MPIVGAIGHRRISRRDARRARSATGGCSPKTRWSAPRSAGWSTGSCSKIESEVTRHLVRERVCKLQMPPRQRRRLAGFGSDPRRARQHPPAYEIYQLAGRHAPLAGRRPRITYADLAAAAALSVLDYLGEIDWRDDAAAREWYTRVKSRPSFRPLLADRVRGLTAGVALCGPRFLTAAEAAAQLIDARGAAAPASTSSRVTAPDAIPHAPARLAAVRRRRLPRHDGLDGRDAGAPRATRGAVAGGALGHRARHELRPGRRPARRAGQPRPRRDLGLCPQPRLSRRHQGPAEGDRRQARRRAPAAT